MNKLPHLRQGETVTFKHYGQERTGTVRHTSGDGNIVFLMDGRWLHRESVTPAADDPAVIDAIRALLA